MTKFKLVTFVWESVKRVCRLFNVDYPTNASYSGHLKKLPVKLGHGYHTNTLTYESSRNVEAKHTELFNFRTWFNNHCLVAVLSSNSHSDANKASVFQNKRYETTKKHGKPSKTKNNPLLKTTALCPAIHFSFFKIQRNERWNGSFQSTSFLWAILILG